MIVIGWLVLYALYSYLQKALKDREQHEQDVDAYRSAVRDCEQWLPDAQMRNVGEPMVSYDVTALQQQLRENEVKMGWSLLGIG